MIISETLIVNAVIYLAGISLIFTTIKGVANGVRDGIRNGKDILNGASVEDIRKREKRTMALKEEEQTKKMASKAYRLIHPLEYLNFMAMRKLRERVR